MHPLLAGPISDAGGADWHAQLERIAAMNFDWLALAPFHPVDGNASLHAIHDPYALHPRVKGRSRKKDATLLREFLRQAHERGIKVMMELVIGSTPAGSVIAETHPEWLAVGAEAAQATALDYTDPSSCDSLTAYWQQVVEHYVELGVSGFLCNAAHTVPARVWESLIQAARTKGASCFVAETLGAERTSIESLRIAGFDFILDSSRWWDFHSPWLTEAHEQLRSIAPTMAFPAGFGSPLPGEEPDTSEAKKLADHYAFRYQFAALSSTALIVPMGYEYAAPVAMGDAALKPGDWPRLAGKSGVELDAAIASMNETKAACRALNTEGSQQLLGVPGKQGTALLRQAGEEGVIILLINPLRDKQIDVPLEKLWRSLGATIETYSELLPGGREYSTEQSASVTLSPLSIRIFHGDYRHTRDHRAEISQLVPNWEVIDAILGADYEDPFFVRGMHNDGPGGSLLVRTFQPGAQGVEVIRSDNGEVVAALQRLHEHGFFAGNLGRHEPFAYRLRIHRDGGHYDIDDPFRFGTVLGEMDVYLLSEGTHRRAYERLGAHPHVMDGIAGVAFAVWAPSARRVAVVGDFNGWDGRCHPMRLRMECGVWEIFIPGIGEGEKYKFEIKGAHGELLPQKSDPFGFAAEQPPHTASIVHSIHNGDWGDGAWMTNRAQVNALDAPVSIYEVHLGSWRRVSEEGNRYLSYRELAEQLIPYVKEMGFTHIELLPVSEFPFDGSWGYQPIGLFAPTSRFGSPADFKFFIEACHQAGIGVLIDWVPGHFPTDPHGLGHFDGSHLYEHADPRQGFHQDWNTLIYNFGRKEVANFLLSNALFWLDRYHIDGLRVDAVASMLYLDYSRKEGEWIPNRFGGNENLDAIDFLRSMNEQVYAEHGGAMTAAEESTSWPGVSRPVYAGGLGFGYKWNMGWMHDTLSYMSLDPVHRCYHHDQMTFGLLYAFSENFILPLSHDEVVHGKGSLLGKMPGDTWQQFANLRAYYGFMWTHPGKKLLFMGGEFAQGREWNHDSSLDWHLLGVQWHAGVQRLVRDLNHLYRNLPALHRKDCEGDGFQWIKANSAEESVYAYARYGGDQRPVVVVCNFTPVLRAGYRVGVPAAGFYRECLNSDAEIYGGSNQGNGGGVTATDMAHDGLPHSLEITLPPLATVIFECQG